MKTIEFKQLDETLYYKQLDNGLDVYILPKKGFSKTFVTFTTKYGSIDRTFVPIGESETACVRKHYHDGYCYDCSDEEIWDAAAETAPGLVGKDADDRLDYHTHERRENPEER